MSSSIHLFGDINEDNLSTWTNISTRWYEDGDPRLIFTLKSDPEKEICAVTEKTKSGKWYVDYFMCKPKWWYVVLREMYNLHPFKFLDDFGMDDLLFSNPYEDENSKEALIYAGKIFMESKERLFSDEPYYPECKQVPDKQGKSEKSFQISEKELEEFDKFMDSLP